LVEDITQRRFNVEIEQMEWKVKWKGHSRTTWEPIESFQCENGETDLFKSFEETHPQKKKNENN